MSRVAELTPPGDAEAADEVLQEALQEVVAEAPAPQEEDTRPRCEECGKPHESTACPYCGWYPALGMFVEIDRQFEALNNEEAAEAIAEEAPVSEFEKHLAVWRTLIPLWGWVTIGACLGILAWSLAIRVALDTTLPAYRTMYSLTQLFAGVAVFAAMHVTAFVLCSSEDAEMGPKDLVVKPFKAWGSLFGELPDRAWLVQVGAGSLAAILGATLIIGGIPYERLLDWGFKERAKPNLIAAITDRAKQMASEDQSLEEAMGEFASDAAGTLDDEAAGETLNEEPRTKVECLVIGYRLTKEGVISALLLASEVDGKLKYIGEVSPTLEPDEMQRLLKKFERAKSTRPFVRTSATAQWLRPRFTCKASYTAWPEGRRPKELQWEELMDEMSLPW